MKPVTDEQAEIAWTEWTLFWTSHCDAELKCVKEGGQQSDKNYKELLWDFLTKSKTTHKHREVYFGLLDKEVANPHAAEISKILRSKDQFCCLLCP